MLLEYPIYKNTEIMRSTTCLSILLAIFCFHPLVTSAQDTETRQSDEAPMRKIETRSELEQIVSDIDIDEEAIRASVQASLSEIQHVVDAAMNDLEIQMEQMEIDLGNLEIDLGNMQLDLESMDLRLPDMKFDAIMHDRELDLDVDLDLDIDIDPAAEDTTDDN